MVEAVFFYAFGALTLGAALSVVLNRRPIYSVLSLLIVMFCLAALFVMLHAPFVAALQILLYAGAVLVLFLFVMMLLNLEPEYLARLRLFTLRGVGTIAAVALFFVLVSILLADRATTPLAQVPAPNGSVESLARLLFTTYLLPFELTSFLILAAIIGAVTLSKQEPPRR